MSHTGGCQCGAIRYVASGTPNRVSHCHCDICRRVSGAVAATFAVFDLDQIAWTGDPPAVYRSTDFAARQFCAKCGSSLSFKFDGRDEMGLAVGTLDDAGATPPIRHNFMSEKISWLHLDPELPGADRWWKPPAGKQ